MHPVVKGVLASPASIEAGALGGRIRGNVVLAPDGLGSLIPLPLCGGEQRTLADFLPTATSVSLQDDEGNPFIAVGSTTQDGAFEIPVLEAGGYELGHRGEVTLLGGALTWDAEVSVGTVDVAAGQVVENVVYTVTAVACDLVGG
jgi:hypothetical protein